jgi:TPR repeat protein
MRKKTFISVLFQIFLLGGYLVITGCDSADFISMTPSETEMKAPISLITKETGLEGLSLISEFRHNLKLTESDDDDAMVFVGTAYLYGKGVDKDEKKAVQYIKKSAALGNMEALGELIRLYNKGLKSEYGYEFIVKNPETAKNITSSGIKNLIGQETTNDYLLLSQQANIFDRGFKDVVAQDPLKAVALYESAFKLMKDKSDAGDLDARYAMARFYAIGNSGVPENEEKSFAILISLANDNYIEAIFDIARAYEGSTYPRLLNDFPEKDKNKSIQYFRKLAEHGHYKSQKSLVRIYVNRYQSDPSPENMKLVEYWSSRALKQVSNDDSLLSSLSEIYFMSGHIEEGVDYLLKAATLKKHKNMSRQMYQTCALYLLFTDGEDDALFNCYSPIDTSTASLWFQKMSMELKRDNYFKPFVSALRSIERTDETTDYFNHNSARKVMLNLLLHVLRNEQLDISINKAEVERLTLILTTEEN